MSTKAINDVIFKRSRQVTGEGWTADNDDDNDSGWNERPMRMNAQEKLAYIEGLQYAKVLCRMAEAGFKSGNHREASEGAKLCAEHIELVLKEMPAETSK